MGKTYLSQAARHAQQGRITQAIATLQTEVQAQGESYTTSCNLAALHLQAGDVETALGLCAKAIGLDPYSYIGYYNRFLCHLSLNNSAAALSDLRRALSCLCLLKGAEESSLKFLNRSIFHCEHNAKAYLLRAKLNEGRNNKLAENDYSAAIEYAPSLPDTYQQRALFLRRQGRRKEFEEDLANYHSLKGEERREPTELIESETSSCSGMNIKEKIEQGIKEFQELMLRSKQIAAEPPKTENADISVSKLPLNSIQSKISISKDEEELLLSDRPDPEEGTAKTIEIKKEEIKFKKRNYEDRLNKNFEQIFVDENSQDLNDEIEKLEREITAEGGRLSLDKDSDELDISDPSNFLTQEIEKAIEEIAKLSNKDMLHDVKSVRSAGSGASIGSKLSEPRELTTDQFKRYTRCHLEVLSLQDLQNPTRKDPAKVQLFYGDQRYETTMGKFQWRQEFSIPLSLQVFEVDIRVSLKGGVFKGSLVLGQGTINLLETANSRCILGNKEKKTAILFFKSKLI